MHLPARNQKSTKPCDRNFWPLSFSNDQGAHNCPGEANIKRIMDGKTKKILLTYMKMVERLNAQGIACSKAQLISKIKYLKTQLTNRQKANRSGASTDALYKEFDLGHPTIPCGNPGQLTLSQQFCKPSTIYRTLQEMQSNKNTPLTAIKQLNFNRISTGLTK